MGGNVSQLTEEELIEYKVSIIYQLYVWILINWLILIGVDLFVTQRNIAVSMR
jgi:hypothetical protein